MTPLRKRQANLFHRYGMSLETYAELQQIQGGACAICQLKGSLTVDHDHLYGHARGLLCQRCNRALGQFKDDMTLVRKAFLYLGGVD